MKNKKLAMLALSVILAGALAGCGNDAASTTTSNSSNSTSVTDTVKIGLNYELSGNVADYGTAELKGSELAIEQFNARLDKPFTVEAISIDNKSETAESTSNATRLIEQDGVAAIVGPATSAASIATYAVADSSQTPIVSPSVTQNNAMLNGNTPYEYAWRVCFEDNAQGKAMAIYAAQTLNAKKAVIFNETSDYGRGLTQAFTQEFTSKGGEVVKSIEYNAKDTDFSSYITGIKDLDYDVMYIAGYYNEAGLIIKQARADGVTCPIIGADGFDSTKLVELAGADNLNQVYYTTAYTTINTSEKLEAFTKAYKEKYNEDPGMFAALAYDATNLVLDNLEATGKTGAELNEAIKKANFSGVTGDFTFDQSNHSPNKKVLVVELTQGAQSGYSEVAAD